MATGATETGGSSTASEIGNLEMSTKSNIIPNLLPTSETGGSSTASEIGNLEMSTKSNIIPNLLPTSEAGGSSTASEIGNLEMSTKSNIIPNILPTSETGGSSTVSEIGNLEMSTKSNITPNILPTSERGSSTPANGSGALALDIKKMFESLNQKFSNGELINVPNHLRKLDEQAYTPLLISIGPIHHSNAKLQSMKKVKLRYCEGFIERANIDLENLVEGIIKREEEIRSYYEETILSSISREDFVTMIVVDGTFILEYILRQTNPNFRTDGKIAEWMPSILKFDLVLLENQLPFFVLEMLYKELFFQDGIKPLKELAFEFFKCHNFQMMDFRNFGSEIEHFTDLVRLFYLYEELPMRIEGGAKLSYTATQLHEVGVKFKGIKFDEKTKGYSRGHKGFLDIRFDWANGVLEIPCMKLNDEKIRVIRNIIALEQSLYVGHAYVTDFFVILDFLINTSKDVDLLCDKGILVNYLGDSNAAASAVNSLNTNISWDYMNPNYLIICEDLNAFYKTRWHKWKVTLWRQYFSTPWRAASTSAAIILLLLTLAQTVCSLKSTIW